MLQVDLLRRKEYLFLLLKACVYRRCSVRKGTRAPRNEGCTLSYSSSEAGTLCSPTSERCTAVTNDHSYSHVLTLPEIFRLYEGRRTKGRSLVQPLAPEAGRSRRDILPASPEPFALSVSLRSAALHVSHLHDLMMLLIVSWECLPDGSGLRLPRASLGTTKMLTRCILPTVAIASDNNFGVWEDTIVLPIIPRSQVPPFA